MESSRVYFGPLILHLCNDRAVNVLTSVILGMYADYFTLYATGISVSVSQSKSGKDLYNIVKW